MNHEYIIKLDRVACAARVMVYIQRNYLTEMVSIVNKELHDAVKALDDGQTIPFDYEAALNELTSKV